MKTPDEWIEGSGGLWELTCTNESDHTAGDLKKVVEQIQGDALSHAATEIKSIARGWKERAQKCRDEAHDQIDWDNPGTAANRLLVVAKQLEDCARELEIIILGG